MQDTDLHAISLNPRRLKALAHPMRLRLLTLLRDHGPQTATELARVVGEVTSGTTSYHLRQLALHGFVEEAADRRKGRERRWQALHPATRLNIPKLLADPATGTTMQALLHEALAIHIEWLTAWLESAPRQAREWIDASVFTDRIMSLSVEQLTQLASELRDIINRYAAQSDSTDNECQPVTVLLYAFPRLDLKIKQQG